MYTILWRLLDTDKELRVQAMKLTRRGKRVRALILLTALLTGAYGVHFYTTHHRVYGNCHTTVDGKVCDLIRWEKN